MTRLVGCLGLLAALTGCAGTELDCSGPRTVLSDGTSYSSGEDGPVIYGEDGKPFHGMLVAEPVCR